ncbi:AAA family ATPase [Mucilaginibacter celer]|uniref:ATP-binding protein n=1 Tax=Mucilaginibacter celer TaxID=2305508 RepID=A0A494VIE4_9SPHI|nr:ATP-binding protein [Mucilaginibacter celer]AYL93914.1 ATP-binding protein [Mucilaginibacter celer]
MIKSATISNFIGYQDFNFGFAPINIIIGKNDTGKTGLLKLLYTCCKTIDTYSRRSQNEEISFKKILAEKLLDVYQPGKKGLGELVNKSTKEKLRVDIEFNHAKFGYDDRLHFSFGDSTTNTINDCQERIKFINDNFRCLFIPAKEVLTSLRAIRATRDNLHMPGFDDTYLDLIRALVIPTQKGNVTEELKSVNRKLEDLFEGHIDQAVDDDFVFKKGNTEFPMQLTAEGVKKIGILTTLIRNRQLNSNSILFLDEPETALHPEATRELVEMLLLMAKSGIQIFLATHNYFVLKQFHLSASRDKVKTNCYSLTREKGKYVRCVQYDIEKYFPENEITEEAVKMADEETRLNLNL